MGLFNRKNKDEKRVQPKPVTATSGQTEFDADLIAWMESDEQDRNVFLKKEFEKAISLLENQTRDSVHRAYDLMGNMASKFDYIPAIMWMGDFAEGAMQNMQKAAFWYKKAADLGDGNGARCFADMLMAGKGVERNFPHAMHYYADAADKGVLEAAFVLGEFHRNNGEHENALKAYQTAADGGYYPAQTRIDQMKNGQ